MDGQELTRLIERFSPTVFRTAYCYVKNRADADDITQDVFFKLFTCGRSFESDEHIKAWLIRAAINRAKNLINSSRYKLTDDLDAAAGASAVLFETQTGTLLPLLMRLKPKQRTALYMFYYEDYSVKEISGILRISQSAVKMRLERGREQLKKLLTEEDDDYEIGRAFQKGNEKPYSVRRQQNHNA